MKKNLFYIIIFFCAILPFSGSAINEPLSEKLSGRILLQVESLGEAWYINPQNHYRYSLSSPQEALSILSGLGIGISNDNLNRIPVALLSYSGTDTDNDSLPDKLEDAMGTDKSKTDSDLDGYNDYIEIKNSYNPLGAGILKINNAFTAANVGKIFLQVESHGEAWYINPVDGHRYFLGSPSDCLKVLSGLGLGITNSNLSLIQAFSIPSKTEPDCSDCDVINKKDPDTVLETAGKEIIAGNSTKALEYFTDDLKKRVEYSLKSLSSENRFTFGNILTGAKLKTQTEKERIYGFNVYFSLASSEVTISITLSKQENGDWLISNL